MKYYESRKIRSIENWIPVNVDLSEGKNKLNSTNYGKVGVLELSSRAVKLLIGDKNLLDTDGFDFEFFYRKGYLTQTIHGLNDELILDEDYFERQVLPVIIKQVEKAKYLGVKVLYAVGTAVYRKARNRKAIVRLIKRKANIDVKILKQEEEAILTLEAFMFSGSNHIRKRKDLLLIDQGGASTEILQYRKRKQTLLNYNLKMGTSSLKDIFFSKSKDNRALEKSFWYYNEYVKKATLSKLSGLSDYRSRNLQCVGLGTAMTKATDEIGNKNQHGKILTRKDLVSKMKYSQKILCDKFKNVGEIKSYFDENIFENEQIYYEEILLMRLGLAMILEIMRTFNVYTITISGTGLWYGVYYESTKQI